jgi:hypothetical protein
MIPHRTDKLRGLVAGIIVANVALHPSIKEHRHP